MSDDNSMDVDDVPQRLLPAISLSQSFSTSSSSPPLPQAEVDKFQKAMTRTSKSQGWSVRITNAGSDKAKLRDMLFLVIVVATSGILPTALKKNIIAVSDGWDMIDSLNDDEVEEWKNLVQKEDWVGLVKHPKLQKPAKDLAVAERTENILRNYNQKLGEAYTQDYIGDFATQFINHIERVDAEEEMEGIALFTKAISVVQSSGTGKSRMLTEVGKQIFTLPICLRKSTDLGYPPGDEPVVEFFSTLPKNNDLTIPAHCVIACLLAAAHEMMLEILESARKEKGLNGQDLLMYWHELMEPTGARNGREEFYRKVVERANTLKSGVKPFVRPNGTKTSPSREKGDLDFDPIAMANYYYEKSGAQKAVNKLMEFLSEVLPGQRMSVMYFDEVHELGSLVWTFMRILQLQSRDTKMWYVFIGTTSRISYYAPPPSHVSSARLKQESSRILPPYFDLGFDQRAIAKGRAPVTVRMGEMETIKFISQYGRPMWSALPEVTESETIYMASYKLLNGEVFDVENKDHVFAVLSQRLCLDLVPTAAEAIKLADRSVGHYVRLITGVSTNSNAFYTHSPSEPVLVMGSVDILYNNRKPDLLGRALNTLSQDLCGAGLVEKGILGELGARTLMLIARDFTTPFSRGQNFLKPVRLMHFLGTLFGKDKFTFSDKLKFDKAFGKAHVNFTHWISTRDRIPEQPDEQLLANLWARGAALQCCFSQERIYLLIPVYYGSVHPDAIFDPSLLSAIVVQVKNKSAGDKDAELAIRPIGVVRDRDQPLPYLAILMELGNKSCYKENGKKIKYSASEPLVDGAFRSLYHAWDKAVEALRTYPSKGKKNVLEGLKKKVNNARLAVDSCNRYSISVRGVSQQEYGILREAKIQKEFATLLSIVIPDNEDSSTINHMRPFESLSNESYHTDWTREYGVSNEAWQL